MGAASPAEPPGSPHPVDEQEPDISRICDESVRRLAARLEGAEVGCLFRFGDVLRHVAHSGRLHLIYEVPSDQGGVAWRAAHHGELQLVENVKSDPDYLATDESVRSEIAAPVRGPAGVIAVLDIEFPDRVFDQAAVAAVEEEAERLGADLGPYVS
jgi:putative methionine-R-sulfoxide reductase with GAF domain